MRWVFTLDEDFHIYGESTVLMATYVQRLSDQPHLSYCVLSGISHH